MEGQLLPLALVCPSLEEARGGLNRAVASARERLSQAATIGKQLKVRTRCLLRLDEDIAGGMSRSALEQSADLLMIGAGRPDKVRRWFFGDLVDGVCRSAHCPVVVVNLAERPVETLQRILVPIKDLSASARDGASTDGRCSRTPGSTAANLRRSRSYDNAETSGAV